MQDAFPQVHEQPAPAANIFNRLRSPQSLLRALLQPHAETGRLPSRRQLQAVDVHHSDAQLAVLKLGPPATTQCRDSKAAHALTARGGLLFLEQKFRCGGEHKFAAPANVSSSRSILSQCYKPVRVCLFRQMFAFKFLLLNYTFTFCSRVFILVCLLICCCCCCFSPSHFSVQIMHRHAPSHTTRLDDGPSILKPSRWPLTLDSSNLTNSANLPCLRRPSLQSSNSELNMRPDDHQRFT